MSDPQRSGGTRMKALERALAMARRNLEILEEQVARYGGTAPIQLLVEFQEQRARIVRLEALYLSETSQPSTAQVGSSEATTVGEGSVAISGDVTGIVAGYQHDLEETRALGDRHLEGILLSNLGAVYADSDNLHRATEHYEQSLAIARELGDQQAEAIRHQNLGLALLRLADAEPEQRQVYLSRAAEALRHAVELFDALNAPQLRRACARYHLGRSYHRLGRWREAIEQLEQAREAFSRRKARPELAHTLLELGQLYHQYQDFESAYLYSSGGPAELRCSETPGAHSGRGSVVAPCPPVSPGSNEKRSGPMSSIARYRKTLRRWKLSTGVETFVELLPLLKSLEGDLLIRQEDGRLLPSALVPDEENP